MRNNLIDTFVDKASELHAIIGGFMAAHSGREERVYEVVYGESTPRTMIEEDMREQGWYALGGVLAYLFLFDDQ